MDKALFITQIKNILVDELFIAVPADEISEDASIANDLGLDSVGFVELGALVSEKFGVTVEDKDLTDGDFATINAIWEFVSKARAKAAA